MKQYFPDAFKLMGRFKEDVEENTVGVMTDIKVWPWVNNKTCLIGDAAHAITPFYG